MDITTKWFLFVISPTDITSLIGLLVNITNNIIINVINLDDINKKYLASCYQLYLDMLRMLFILFKQDQIFILFLITTKYYIDTFVDKYGSRGLAIKNIENDFLRVI